MSSSIFMVVGCYTRPPYVAEPYKDSLYIIKFDKDTNQLSIVTKYDDMHNISYMCKNDDILWVLTEDKESSITQYKIRKFESRNVDNGLIETTPLLEHENTLKFNDSGACYISSEYIKDGSYKLYVTCYDSGVIKLFKSINNNIIDEDKLQLIYCTDKNSQRQESSHPHCIIKWKNLNNTVAVVDLGADTIYQIDTSSNNLKLNLNKEFKLPDNTGPRHMLFHPELDISFVVCELSNELYVLSTTLNNNLTILQKLSLLNYKNEIINDNNSTIQNASHIKLSKNNKYLFCSNRGKINNIIIFKINYEKLLLEFYDIINCNGIFPRFFEIINDEYLIIAYQKSDNIEMYQIDNDKINKEPISTLEIPSPVCIQLFD